MRDEWTDIGAAPVNSDAPTQRRADPKHPLDFWRGRDQRGRYLFTLETIFPEMDLPHYSPAGIELTTQVLRSGNTELRLTLLNSDLVELFRALCVDLMRSTRFLTPETCNQGMAIVLKRLEHWQKMLARRQEKLLSKNEVIGLTGELFFVRDILLANADPAMAINAWRGPYGDEQDFVLNGTIIEIKTQHVTSDRYIQISSEDQLDTSSGRIIIGHQTIGPAETEGVSLNELVEEICQRLSSTDASIYDLFQLGLMEAGYTIRSEYNAPSWMLTSRNFFEVREGFPRIIRADVSSGVEKVTYRIRTENCRQYLMDIDATMMELLHGTA